jgi:Domain of unknown function (DUF4913)
MAASPSLSLATFPVAQALTLSLAGETGLDESDTDPGGPPDEPGEPTMYSDRSTSSWGLPAQRLPTPGQGPQPGVGRALVGHTPSRWSDSGPAGGAVAIVGAPATRRDHRHELWWRDHADHHMAVLMDPDGTFACAKSDADENVARRSRCLCEAPPGLFGDLGRARD